MIYHLKLSSPKLKFDWMFEVHAKNLASAKAQLIWFHETNEASTKVMYMSSYGIRCLGIA